MKAALAHGGNDNITVIVADVEDDGQDVVETIDEVSQEARTPGRDGPRCPLRSKRCPPPTVASIASSARSAPTRPIRREPRPAPRVRERARKFERLVTLRVILFVVVLFGALWRHCRIYRLVQSGELLRRDEERRRDDL